MGTSGVRVGAGAACGWQRRGVGSWIRQLSGLNKKEWKGRGWSEAGRLEMGVGRRWGAERAGRVIAGGRRHSRVHKTRLGGRMWGAGSSECVAALTGDTDGSVGSEGCEPTARRVLGRHACD